MNSDLALKAVGRRAGSRLLDQGITGVLLLVFMLFAYITLGRMWKNEDDTNAERKTLIQNVTQALNENTVVMREIKEELHRK